MSLWTPVCVILGLYCACAAGFIFIRNRSTQPSRLPVATFLLLFAVALPTTLQLPFPAILPLWQRDYGRFVSGDWWRVITPLFVQDGGVAGAIFNLVGLILLGAVAELLWGSQRMLLIFFAGGIASEVVAFAWQPIGAGNSVGNLSLAASIAVLCLAPRAGAIAQVTALLALSADVMLIVLKDIHGAAAVAGVLLALAMGGRQQFNLRIP